ncbi:hypothetical protein SDC9_178618 [bioreactor metagenome]|uniref:Uncharacterized protein n=1 Tax=bioreactor metagenome TaxID=1076179 RepID=A0A645H491_9ZZZZ
MCANPDNQQGDTVHNQHHDRHQKNHGPVDKEVVIRHLCIFSFKAFTFKILVPKGADHRHPIKVFTHD